MSTEKQGLLRTIGPGLVVAATGVGAGDLIAASVAGARYGTVLLWAVLLGALIKYGLNEGLARWQLATGTTLLEGWVNRLPRLVSLYFLVYLSLWTFVVAGALIAACGLAAHALVPALSVKWWGVIHSLVAAALVWTGRYALLERVMKCFIALMFLVVLVCAFLADPHWPDLARGLFDPTLPAGSVAFVLGLVGGVGGSVTLLSYGYWIREKAWQGPKQLARSRVDLAAAYGLTALFGVAIVIISAGVRPEVVSGNRMALAVAEQFGVLAGPAGKWLFLGGFWGAVFSSMLGVWQGIPYLFNDFFRQYGRRRRQRRAQRQEGLPARSVMLEQAGVDTRSPAYRLCLLLIALPPMLLLLADRPVWLVVVYAVSGAFFMPFLAGLLLYMNNQRDWVGGLASGWKGNSLLLVTLLLFLLLLVVELIRLG